MPLVKCTPMALEIDCRDLTKESHDFIDAGGEFRRLTSTHPQAVAWHGL
jgi:hypothetical protein